MSQPNSLRGFAETISLDSWRTKFEGESGVADLHLDVLFREGRIGGDTHPVSFRLNLKRAEIRILTDAAGILQFLPASVKRADIVATEHTIQDEHKTSADVNAKMSLSPTALEASVGAGSGGSHSHTATSTTKKTVGPVQFRHRRIDEGYAFDVTPASGRTLDGQPWGALETVLKIRDRNHPRKGDPPEPRIEIRCKREDLSISDVRFKGEQESFFNFLSQAKQRAVEAYIRDQMTSMGVDVGDLQQPFADILLADIGTAETP